MEDVRAIYAVIHRSSWSKAQTMLRAQHGTAHMVTGQLPGSMTAPALRRGKFGSENLLLALGTWGKKGGLSHLLSQEEGKGSHP